MARVAIEVKVRAVLVIFVGINIVAIALKFINVPAAIAAIPPAAVFTIPEVLIPPAISGP